ncbi:UNVERIFIED_CONTAM: hypothetical protein GTU68_043371 [Idotea baltica]|nr:hypothetical protein [Idotea baltica]
MLKILTKSFQQLNIQELYDLLELRSEVFVVEQDCVYQDVDGKDQKALHVLGYIDNQLVAYTRIFKPGDYFEVASIGRVVVKNEKREFKYGYTIMEASIDAIKTHYNETRIKLSAQTYLTKFYTSLGFEIVGEEYLEDDIPHIAMVKN